MPVFSWFACLTALNSVIWSMISSSPELEAVVGALVMLLLIETVYRLIKGEWL